MKHRPYFFHIMAAFFGLVAVSMPLQMVFLYHHYSLFDLELVFQKLTPMNYLVMMACVFNAYLAYRVDRILLFSLPATIVLVAYNNYIVGQYGFDYQLKTTLVASILFSTVCLGFLHPQYLRILLNPQLRWWLPKIRVRHQIPVFLQTPTSDNITRLKSFDFSESGMFLTGGENNIDRFAPGDFVDVEFKFNDLKTIKCRAEIVRKNQNSGAYPIGLGLRFTNMENGVKKLIKDQVKQNTDLSVGSTTTISYQ